MGEYKPDLPPADHLSAATNVFPTPTGYQPFPAFVAITPALPTIAGGGAFVSSIGETSFIAGTATTLYRYQAGAWAAALDHAPAQKWRFAQFGDNVIGVNGNRPVKYELLTKAASELGGEPPDASLIATVRDFVVLAGDPENILTVTWSGFNDSEGWTPLENQSDSQQMLDGGEVMGLAGGEYGIVLQRNAIKRMTYVGSDIVFQFDEISSNIGCMAKGSVTQAGRLVFFLSSRGFMLCDGNDVKPIGVQKIDATFFWRYSRQDIETQLTAAVDPARNMVVWAMPGTPGLLWCYHWTLDMWSTIEADVSVVFSGYTPSVSLDDLDTFYGSLDAVPGSLDDVAYSGGSPLLLIATTSGEVGLLSGEAMSGTLRLSRFTPADTRRCRIRSVRPLTDASDVTVKIEGAARAGEAALPEQAFDMRKNGVVPMRVNAREIVTTVTLRGPWSYIQALDFEYEMAGVR